MSKYKTIEEVQAVIIGVLFKDEGKIVTSKFNKITREFGLDRVGKDDLKEIVEDIRKDEYLNELKNKAIKGKVTLGDLKDVADNQVFEGNNYHEEVSTYVVAKEKELSHLREQRKHNRHTAYPQIMFDELKEHMVKELQGETLVEHHGSKATIDDTELIVLLSDFHIGEFCA